jgi:hypothetical protein
MEFYNLITKKGKKKQTYKHRCVKTNEPILECKKSIKKVWYLKISKYSCAKSITLKKAKCYDNDLRTQTLKLKRI